MRAAQMAGAMQAVLDLTVHYAGDRVQFGQPIAGFQLTQGKFADMALELDKAYLLAHHLGRAKESGTATPVMVSMAKLNNVREAIEILGNEAVWYLGQVRKEKVYGVIEPEKLSGECLRYLYRLLFLFYVEARPQHHGERQIRVARRIGHA